MGVAKKVLIGIGVALLIIVLVVGYFVLDFLSKPASAELREFTGDVIVSNAKPASQGMHLSEGDSVSTKEGTATIVFFGGTLLRLDKNTEIKITKLGKEEASAEIRQSSGKTWNRVIRAGADPLAAQLSKVQGLNSYDVELPTAVATVRGTSFSSDASSPNKVSAVVGTVGVSSGGKETDASSQTVTISNNVINIAPVEIDSWISQNREKDKKFDRDLVAKIRKKYGLLINFYKKKYGLTDAEVDARILEYLERGGGQTGKI